MTNFNENISFSVSEKFLMVHMQESNSEVCCKKLDNAV